MSATLAPLNQYMYALVSLDVVEVLSRASVLWVLPRTRNQEL